MPEKAAFFHFFQRFVAIPCEISGLGQPDTPTPLAISQHTSLVFVRKPRTTQVCRHHAPDKVSVNGLTSLSFSAGDHTAASWRSRLATLFYSVRRLNQDWFAVPNQRNPIQQKFESYGMPGSSP
jgi:hypothetical protein